MIVTHDEMITLKMNLLGGMHSYIVENGDEEIWSEWITYGVPDCATEEDLQNIAENEKDWKEICKLFGKLIQFVE